MKRSMSGERAHRRIVPTVLFVGALLATLIGCTEGERGIFATIAIEEEIKRNNLVDNVDVSGLVRADFSGTEFYVVKAGRKVFYRAVAGSDWNEIGGVGSDPALFLAGYDTSPPGGSVSGTVDEVYAVYGYSSPGETAIYRLTSALSWELVYTPSQGTYIDGFVSVDEVLFASTADGDLMIWENGPPNLGTPDKTFESSFPRINDVVRYDTGDDGDFVGTDDDFLVTSNLQQLARISADLWALELFEITPGFQPVGVGVAPFDSSIVAVTDLSGAVYITNSKSATTDDWDWNNAGNVDRPASDIVWIDAINNGNGAFLVSTRSDAIRNETGRGYFEAEISGSGGSYSLAFNNELGNNYEASDLAVASINSFRHFGNGVVFALTGGLGLWRTTYPPAGDPEWEWE